MLGFYMPIGAWYNLNGRLANGDHKPQRQQADAA